MSKAALGARASGKAASGGASLGASGSSRTRKQLRGPPKLDLSADDHEPGGFYNPLPGDRVPSLVARRAGKRALHADASFAMPQQDNSFVMEVAKTMDKLEPLMEKGLLQPGPAALVVKCKGEVLSTTASLSNMLQITLDDKNTPVKSINELKTIVCEKHSVSTSTDAWKCVFHGSYSLHALRASLSKPEEDTASLAVGLQPGEAAESDADDSPEITDPALRTPGCPYMQAIAAVQADTLAQLDNAVLHTALRDVIASSDAAAPEALDYLFAVGAPLESLPGQEPFAVLAARRHDHLAYFDLLVALACVDVDFEARSITAGDVVQGEHASAAEIVNARAPRMLLRVKKEALERNSPFWSAY